MKKKFRYKNFVFSFLTLIAFFIDTYNLYTNIDNINNVFKVEVLTLAILFFIFYKFYSSIKNKKLDVYRNILVVLFSIFMIFGNSYLMTNSWNLVFGNYLMLTISILSFIGYYIFFKKIFILLDDVKIKDIKIKKLKRLSNYLEKNPFTTSLIIILLFWLIYIIAFYPIILSPDPSNQIKQYFNLDTKYSANVNLINPNVKITNHHPVLHTVMLGSCLSIGRLLGSDNFGLFIYSIIQILILSSTLAYTIKYLKKLNASNFLIYIVLGIYSLVPMFPFYAMSAVKDVIFSSLIILYTVMIFDFINFYNDKKANLKKFIYLFILILLISMFRNNGLYVIVLSLPLLILVNKINKLKLIIVLVIYLLVFKGYTNILLPNLGITNGSIREALSIPFQQTARYVKYYSDDIDKNDVDVIDSILGYNDLGDRYNPEISDPVKNNFNKDTSKEELSDYFKLWFKYLIKRPNVYIEATINNIYGYFYPNKINWYIYYKFDDRIVKDGLTTYHYNSLKVVRNALISYGVAFPYIPFVGLISNIGFNTWILLYIFMRLLKINKKYLVALSPLIVSLLVCIASPVNSYFRYAMPYVFICPFLVVMYITLRDKIK